MTDSEILVAAYQRGRAWVADPEFAELRNLDQAAVAKMDGSEHDARLLVRSLQLSDANYDPLVLAFHQRLPEYDGSIGPATRALVDIPRCPLPDAPPPPNAVFFYEDPDLQKAVESMQAAAAFVGNYWKGCDSQRPDIHSLVIGIDAKNAPPNWLANKDKILAARIACAAEIGVSVRFVINPQSMEGLQQLQVFKYIAGGVIGYNYFPQSNSCGRISSGSLDTSYDPSDYRLHANLGTHESEGHGFGFNHTRGGVMNPSILLVWPLSWKNDPSWSTAKSYYGGVPIAGGEPPPPPPPPPPGLIPKVSDLQITTSAGTYTYEVRPRLVTRPPPIEV
jgi:hypothetical protein